MSMKFAIGLVLALIPLLADNLHASCPPEGKTKADLIALKDADFVLPKTKDAGSNKDAKPDKAVKSDRDTLALALLDCLGNADPELRDDIAFEALSAWMSGKQLAKPTLLAIDERLVSRLTAKTPDKNGFLQPYAALVLAELVKADRERAFLSNEQFAQLVEAGSLYLESVRDYRGFDARAGWRHGIAHGADLLAQLVAHPRIDESQIERMLVAISAQVAPESGHFYIYGEPERLALPVMYAAQRGAISADDWRDWFTDIAAIPENGSLFASQKELARRHNLQAFLLVLYVNVSESKDEALRESLLAPVTEMLKALQ
jgi:hypothetical protein